MRCFTYHGHWWCWWRTLVGVLVLSNSIDRSMQQERQPSHDMNFEQPSFAIGFGHDLLNRTTTKTTAQFIIISTHASPNITAVLDGMTTLISSASIDPWHIVIDTILPLGIGTHTLVVSGTVADPVMSSEVLTCQDLQYTWEIVTKKPRIQIVNPPTVNRFGVVRSDSEYVNDWHVLLRADTPSIEFQCQWVAEVFPEPDHTTCCERTFRSDSADDGDAKVASTETTEEELLEVCTDACRLHVYVNASEPGNVLSTVSNMQTLQATCDARRFVYDTCISSKATTIVPSINSVDWQTCLPDESHGNVIVGPPASVVGDARDDAGNLTFGI